PNGGELALDQICRIIRLVTADRGSALAPTHSPLQPERSHQSFDATAGDGDALPAELSPDLACAVDLEVLIPDALDLLRDLDITPNPRRRPIRLSLTRLLLVVCSWGDRQLRADRLDPILTPMLVDEGDHYFGRRSSFAWAKKAAALRRISLARFNSRFSRSSSLRRSRSALVSPGRLPWSRSDCRTHSRNVSGVHPILLAIELIAAHCDSCSPWCSKTIRTARSRTSGEYFCVVFMTPILSRFGVSGKPGAVQINRLRSVRLILICAQTNHMSLLQTDPGSIQPCVVLPDDAGNELFTRGHAVFPFFHHSMDG